MELVCRPCPDDYVKHFERYATSVSIIGFGRRVESNEDPIITEVIAVMQLAAELNVPGKKFPMLMETFPFLARFPNAIAPWKHGLGSKRGRGFFYALAEEAATKPGHEDSFVKHLFAARDKYTLDDEEISSLSGNLFGAGSDTSSSTLITFVLACCAFPEALVPAYEELDRVVGPYRSPHFDDQPNLPYVNALVKEVLRWRLLWGFHIQKKRQPDGSLLEVDIFNYTNGLNMRPRPFECSIEPRTEEIRQTIIREGRQALQDLQQYSGETKYRMSTFYQRNDLAMKLFGDGVK
ncbi:hypothetical protein INS49_005316 [Diaporthe citri]|uniref:uncharacterized protein n=1 Tax=Diaporthe citri TaxID=83186 RepID=UPI001C82248B|nr:uncharacterized protein INS49_005316 [Diaporthe citri]KAG6353835.1 hypothetical protein INS49_005316 [Diaporthe citri]